MKIYDLRLEDNQIYYGAGTNGTILLEVGAGTDGVESIKIDGSSSKTTGNIKVGDSYGLTWGDNTFIYGNAENDMLMQSEDTSGNFGYVQVTPTLVDIHGNSVSLGTGNSAFVIDEAVDGVSFIHNGEYATFKNDLLTTSRTYSLPNENGVLTTASGVAIKVVNATTISALTATYSNGVSGIGATLTSTTNGILPTQDGVSITIGQRLLVRNQSSALQNGIYILTTVGSVSAPWILTRATDSDTSSAIINTTILVKQGSTYFGTLWLCSNQNAITVGSTNITYFNSFFSIGSGLTLTGKTLTALPTSNTITRAMLTDSLAYSVIGRPSAFAGVPSDIVASSAGQVLKRFGTSIGFHAIGNEDISNNAVTYAKIQNISANRILGKVGSTGVVQELALSSGLAFSGASIIATGGGAFIPLAGNDSSNLITGDLVFKNGKGIQSSTGTAVIELYDDDVYLYNDSGSYVDIYGNQVLLGADEISLDAQEDIYINSNNGNGVSINANGVGSYINIGAGNGYLYTDDNFTQVYGDNGGLTVYKAGYGIYSDNGSSASGIRYNADYSTNYTNRSLVDKEYVVNLLSSSTSGGGLPLASSAGNGLKVYANKIKLGGSLTEHTSVDGSTTYDMSFSARNFSWFSLNPTIVYSSNPIKYALDVVNQYDDRSLVDKGYVDNTVATASNQNVKFRTTANLTATYSNGVSGVGATLTATTNSTLPTIDGIVVASMTVGDRILVANQTTTLQNGIYVITSKGVAGVSPFILTRATDSDTSAKLYMKIIKVELGTAFSSTTIINSNTTAITLGTTGITYAFHGNYTTGAGITLTNRTFSIGNTSITRNMLVNGVATSIIGRSINSSGSVGDIIAGSDGQVLKRVGGVLGFNTLGASDLPVNFIDGVNRTLTSGTTKRLNWSTNVLIQNDTSSPTPTPSAILEIVSTTQGLLPPRMTTAQRTAIVSPVGGLMVFDTTAGTMMYYNGITWSPF